MESLKIDVNKVTDLIASKFVADGGDLSVLKLQKLLYYVEAWHVTFFNKQIFDDDFEAWVHGPVCREVFDRFKYRHKKFIYSDVSKEDIDLEKAGDFAEYEAINSHVEKVLETYGKFSGYQLESLTHKEAPWINARGNLPPNQPCNNVITKESMRAYYLKLMG